MCLLVSNQCLAELEDKQWLFPYDQLEIGEDLGSGAFGVVKKAVAHNVRADGSSIVVAVKMLKGEVLIPLSFPHSCNECYIFNREFI